MDTQLARRIGQRVRFYRAASHLTKVVVAGLSGITEDYLYQIERGLKLPTIPVLMALADALGVTVNDLLHGADDRPGQPTQPASGDDLHRALTVPQVPDSPADLDHLGQQVRAAWSTWQTSPTRYSELDAELPALIVQAEHAITRHTGKDERTACRHATDLYGLVRTVAKRKGRIDLSLLAADRASRAGQEADDPLKRAAASWNLAQVLLADKEYEGTETVALTAIRDLAPEAARDGLDALALKGSLLLVSAIAAARQGHKWQAHDRIREAEVLAARTGERNTAWTAFGPINVRMFAVSAAVETGEAAEALRLAERLDYQRSPSIERRVAFLLDQAKGYEQRRDYASALVMLTATAEEAPEDVRHRPAAHQLLSTLVQRGRRTVTSEAARLAVRVGVPL